MWIKDFGHAEEIVSLGDVAVGRRRRTHAFGLRVAAGSVYRDHPCETGFVCNCPACSRSRTSPTLSRPIADWYCWMAVNAHPKWECCNTRSNLHAIIGVHYRGIDATIKCRDWLLLSDSLDSTDGQRSSSRTTLTTQRALMCTNAGMQHFLYEALIPNIVPVKHTRPVRRKQTLTHATRQETTNYLPN
jgi:hypothetical protein